jgi:uncharacterized protein (TIGR02186 family)
MYRVHRSAFYMLSGIMICLAVLMVAGNASATLTAKANHDHINIDFFYHGSTVSVKGITEPGTDLIIKIASPEGHESLKEKGKVGGILWMNVGTKKFENVPNLYAVHSTRKLDDMISRDELDKYVIGYPALGRHVEIDPVTNVDEKTRWFNEFIKYKERSNLYSTTDGKIEMQEKYGHQSYYILTQWPYQAPPGDYIVTVYAVKDGKVVDQAESRVQVEQAGMVKTLAGMAKNNAALYGFISIVSALGTGFGVGLVFRKGGGAH